MPRANDFCREILPAVSRTFAVSIRLLPGALGNTVRTAYLICRIADTIEDDPKLEAQRKGELFDLLAECFDRSDAAALLASSSADVSGDPAHVRLLRNTHLVFEAYAELSDDSRGAVRHWVREMITGMRAFALKYPQGVRIQTLDEYRDYCYYVAGTVGYLLTDLWREHSRSIGDREYQVLRDRCRAFAEALQTVNILKDVARDVEHENAIYIPVELLREYGSSHETMLDPSRLMQTREALGALVQLAWHDLDEATQYLLAIPRRAVSIRLFCALPLLFAYATLRDLTRNPGALARRETVKISRAEVKSLTVLAMLGVMSNRFMRRLIERTRTRAVSS
jgi:farnesyl-diphosphate farnesyltransferase